MWPGVRDVREVGATIVEALDRVGLGGRGKETIYHLSGGEQQRVALARLMVKQPTLVLADEPTGALDDANATMVVDILREMSEAGCAVVIATHNEYVRDGCDTVFTVKESSLVRSR
ncbi:ATP-binding cassette domain-containing protein [Streptomyces sp. NPDC002133]|uniref:ATP-binding cassette domain-containing protein n=1 Tax=Streptomyces sp. NPDC002133 TaxID=3154409 RepID=UPI00331C70E3